MEHEKQSSRGHGGARPNSGRKPGATQKLTAKDLLAQAEATVGKPFAVSLMEGYRDSILDGDTKTRVTYEKIIIDKVATTMFDVEVEEVGDIIEAKKQAFREAILALNINNKEDNTNATD